MLLRRTRNSGQLRLLAAGMLLAVIALFVLAPATSASGGHPPMQDDCGWYASYFNNTDLKGYPEVKRCDGSIDFEWRGGEPASGVGPDNFSVLWVRNYDFSPGTYRFKATMDDGMRFYVNGNLVINGWQEGAARTLEADVAVSGPTKLVVEYFQLGGNAVAGFTWDLISDGGPVPPTGKPMPPTGKPMPPTGQPMPPAGQPMPPSGQPMPPSGNPNVDYPIAEVKAAYLNVRSGPGVSNSVVGVLHQNTKVYMIARSSGGKWILIQTDGLRGWVNKYYLHSTFPFTSLPFAQAGNPAPMPPQTKPPADNTAAVTASMLNVRSGPGVTYRAIAVVHGGTQVQILEREPNGWVKIAIPGSVTGFVNGSYLAY